MKTAIGIAVLVLCTLFVVQSAVFACSEDNDGYKTEEVSP